MKPTCIVHWKCLRILPVKYAINRASHLLFPKGHVPLRLLHTHSQNTGVCESLDCRRSNFFADCMLKRKNRPGLVNLSFFRNYASGKYTRQERINEARFTSQMNLESIDKSFGIYNKNVTKVVDLGSAPGTWLRHTRNRLLGLHGLKPEEIYKKCTVIGVDLLFFQPPRGAFSSQGNIFSQNTHTQVETLLKESALRLSKSNIDFADPDISYILRELDQIQLEASISPRKGESTSGSMEKTFSSQYNLSPHAHQADLLLSDLGAPHLQESGFHNNTLSKPFIRSSLNPMLRQPWDNPEKSLIDLAEAALLLCGNILTKGGTFVLRLPKINLADPELLLLEARLGLVFREVFRWSDNGRVESTERRMQSLFMVCKGKKDHIMDKYAVFGVKRD